MRSSDDKLRSAFGRWVSFQPRIQITLEVILPQFSQTEGEAVAEEVNGGTVTFRIIETGATLSLDFSKADIRGAPIDSIEADEIVLAFSAYWESADATMRGVFVERCKPGIPN